MGALFHAQQALLDGGRQLAAAKRERGWFAAKGTDRIAIGPGQPVVQCEKGAGFNPCNA